MSWMAYVDNLIASNESKLIADAAICGCVGQNPAVWATSPGLKLTEEEIKRLSGSRTDFGQNGVTISGLRCRMLRDLIDDDKVLSMSLLTKEDEDGVRYSVVVGKSKTALVIAKGCKDAKAPAITKTVFEIVKHLKDANM